MGGGGFVFAVRERPRAPPWLRFARSARTGTGRGFVSANGPRRHPPWLRFAGSARAGTEAWLRFGKWTAPPSAVASLRQIETRRPAVASFRQY
jgi:hypothetical protein